MSNLAVNAFKNVQNSEFIFGTKTGPRDIEIRNAVILFRNLSGSEQTRKRKDGTTFKTRGADFKVAITEDFLAELNKLGQFSISTMNVEEDSNLNLYLLKVKVTMDSEWPPVVKLYTRTKDKISINQLTEETISTADRVDIERADIIIHPSEYDTGKFSLYLKQMNIVTEEALDFGGFWDELGSKFPEGEFEESPF